MRTSRELLEYLTGVCPAVSKGVVTLMREKETEQEEVVPLPDGAKAYVDSHPEGSDRGGYVPYVELASGVSVYYYEGDGEWHLP
jgi:uracil phosphoribosyltransferase